MATIKEVAKEARVSVGTVSNVINGKTKNLELIERVEEAIKVLGFIPDSKAKHLKSSKSNLIGLILESRLDAQSRNAITEINSFFSEKGYDVIVNSTDGNEVVEEKIVQHYLRLGVDGIIVNTASNNKKWFQQYKSQIPVVFMYNTQTIEQDMEVVRFSYQKAMKSFDDWFEATGKKKLGFILGENQTEIVNLSQHVDDTLIKKVGEASEEWGFKQAFELLSENKAIDTILVGNYSLLTGVIRALELLKIANVALVCIKNKNWLEDVNVLSGIIHIPLASICHKSCEILASKIKKNNYQGNHTHNHEAVFIEIKPEILSPEKTCGNTLKIGVLESKVINPLINMSRVYQKNTGVILEFIPVKYKELASLLSDTKRLKESKFDLVMYDILWKNKLLKSKLSQLTSDFQNNYFKSFIEQAVENYGEIDEALYGLPLLGGTQLLIYQKDLFEDAAVKRLFKLIHGHELQVPETWEEYELVAEFFTREYNQKSPVKYGVSMITEGSVYSSIEFLNRLLSYASLSLIDRIDEVEERVLEIALKRYLQAFKYSNQSLSLTSWEEMADELKKGDTAMAIMYDSFIYDINDSVQSRVAGNIGSAQIPGGKPILGGWGMGVSTFSVQKELAENYLCWLCSSDVSLPLSTLTGASIHKEFYENKDLDRIYPWKKEVLEGYQHSVSREELNINESPIVIVDYYERNLGKLLQELREGNLNDEEVIKRLQTRL